MNRFIIATLALVFMAIGSAAHAQNNDRWQRDWDYVEHIGNTRAVDNPCLCKCVQAAKRDLEVNQWHANLGDANIAAHDHRANYIMPGFENCMAETEALGAGNCPSSGVWRNCS